MRTIEHDLKLYWSLYYDSVKMLEEIVVDMEKKKQALKYVKGEIRKRNRWADEYKPKPEDDWRCRYPDDGYYDTRYVKYKLPYHMTEEEKEEFINEEWCHWYNPYNDGRDCTGVWFTSRIKVIDCGNNETIIIHVQNCDV